MSNNDYVAEKVKTEDMVYYGSGAYSLVAIPISWGSSIIVALWTIPLAVRDWQARREALRHGAAPQGKTASGEIRPIPGFVRSILWAAIGFASLFTIELLLYLLAGSDNTIRRGRVLPPLMIDFQTTFLMAVTQFLAMIAISILILAALNLKKFVKS